MTGNAWAGWSRYSGQIVLGNDVFSKVQTRRFGGTGYRHLVEWVVPTLRDLGVSDYDIRQMTVENPARLWRWDEQQHRLFPLRKSP